MYIAKSGLPKWRLNDNISCQGEKGSHIGDHIGRNFEPCDIVVPWFRLTLILVDLGFRVLYHRFQTTFDRTQSELLGTLELINRNINRDYNCNQNTVKNVKLFMVNILKPRFFKVAIMNIMNNCASHAAKTWHITSGQHKPCLCLHSPESLLQMSKEFTKGLT